MSFEPDYRHFKDVMQNRRPARLPIYEHILSPVMMEHILGVPFAELSNGNTADIREFFRHYCAFFKQMTYDTVSFEMCICEALPSHGAIYGGMKGPIQTRFDFEHYPWNDIPTLYWKSARPQFDALVENLPPGMKVNSPYAFFYYQAPTLGARASCPQ